MGLGVVGNYGLVEAPLSVVDFRGAGESDGPAKQFGDNVLVCHRMEGCFKLRLSGASLLELQVREHPQRREGRSNFNFSILPC